MKSMDVRHQILPALYDQDLLGSKGVGAVSTFDQHASVLEFRQMEGEYRGAASQEPRADRRAGSLGRPEGRRAIQPVQRKALRPDAEGLWVNHQEAYQLAQIREDASNLARCYIDLRGLLHEITASDPTVASEADGSLSCHYCENYMEGLSHRGQHDPGCLWLRAKALSVQLAPASGTPQASP